MEFTLNQYETQKVKVGEEVVKTSDLLEKLLEQRDENGNAQIVLNANSNAITLEMRLDDYPINELLDNQNVHFFNGLKRYNIGKRTIEINGEHYASSDFGNVEQICAFLKKNEFVFRQVDCYQHGDIHLYPKGEYRYGDSYDTGIAGFIFVDKKTALEIAGNHTGILTEEEERQVGRYLNGVIKNIDGYLNNHYYMIDFSVNGELFDTIGIDITDSDKVNEAALENTLSKITQEDNLEEETTKRRKHGF